MSNSANYQRVALGSASIALMLATALTGCSEPPQIRSYTVPKEPKYELAAEPTTPPPTPPPTQPTGEPTDRMLVAVMPVAGQAWFFKAVGPIPEIEKHEKEITDFFATLELPEDGKPKWKLPEGWKEGSEKPMRLATIIVPIVPAEPKPLEIAVSGARWDGTPQDVLTNINRWRGQLKLAPLKENQIAEVTRELKAGDKTLTLVDLRGHFAGASMTPPFAGGANAPQQPPSQAEAGLPAGHPPLDGPPTQAPPLRSPPPAAVASLKYTVPKDWKELPADGLRKATFTIGDEKHGAILTVIDFPATEGPMIADPLTNVNRWRQQVGLDEVKANELSKATETIEIDGKPATYVRAVPDTSQPSQSKASIAILAAMAKQDDRIWFIKLTGNRTVVAAQEDAFKSFLKSLRFSAGSGDTDGHK